MQPSIERPLKDSKTHVIRFVLVAKGLEKPVVLMHRSKISPELIRKVKEEIDGKVINEGFVYWTADDEIIFRCKNSYKSQLEMQLRTLVLAQVRQLVRVKVERGSSVPKHPVRVAKVVEEEDEDEIEQEETEQEEEMPDE